MSTARATVAFLLTLGALICGSPSGFAGAPATQIGPSAQEGQPRSYKNRPSLGSVRKGAIQAASDADMKSEEVNCVSGCPQSGQEVGPAVLIHRRGYVLLHSSNDKIPLWVAEHVTAEAVSGPLRRPKPEPFRPDPVLVEAGQPHAELTDYRGSGYDRGHQAPSANQTTDAQLQADTYYLSNMAPQWAALNQRIWAGLEDKIRNWAEARGEVWTITGPLFYDPKEDDPKTATGSVEYEVIGSDEVAVPTHFFKIVIARSSAIPQRYEALAFVLPNQRQEFPKPWDYSKYLRSIRWVETHSGLNFNPRMARVEQDDLETATPTSIWPE